MTAEGQMLDTGCRILDRDLWKRRPDVAAKYFDRKPDSSYPASCIRNPASIARHPVSRIEYRVSSIEDRLSRILNPESCIKDPS
jgi:hypothetical protein